MGVKYHLARASKIAVGSSLDQRRQETRTKIQLGGLVLKAGLAKLLHINPGDDLQADPSSMQQATTLLGALLDMVQKAETDPALVTHWTILGENAMRQTFLKRKDGW